MARKVLVAGAAYLFVAVLAPIAASATSINVNTNTPVRPHVHLNAPLHLDVRPRTFHDLDLSETCRADERIKKRGKREWRCRQDR